MVHSPIHRAELLGGEAADTDAHRPRRQRYEIGEATVTVARTSELCMGKRSGMGKLRSDIQYTDCAGTQVAIEPVKGLPSSQKGMWQLVMRA